MSSWIPCGLSARSVRSPPPEDFSRYLRFLRRTSRRLPHRGGATRRPLRAAADTAEPVQRRQCRLDLRCWFVPAEESGNLGLRHRPPHLEGVENEVSQWISQTVSEDSVRRGLGILPEGERCLEMGRPDRRGSVERGVEGGEAEDLGFGARDDSADQPRLSFAERFVDAPPHRGRDVVACQLVDSPRLVYDGGQLSDERIENLIRHAAPFGEDL